MRVAIAGAGIGGLTLTAALRRRGIDVQVLERASSIQPVGAGITVQANAMTALATLGLADAVAAAGVALGEIAMLDRRGRPLGPVVDVGALSAELGAPTIAIHRARLHRVLLDAAGVEVTLGATVVSYEPRGERVLVRTTAGEVEADLLIGADGLHSAVRAQMIGDGEPSYAGYTSWRGVAPYDELTRATESWGRGARFGLVPIGHGEAYWFAVATVPAGGADGDDVIADLRARFAGWHAPIDDVLAATPRDKVLRTDIRDRRPITTWHAGRAVLLGDAAHPMTPNYGQGGCQAIEDAIVLDRALAAHASIDDALAAYEAARVARANAIVVGARRLGRVAAWSSAPACALRDLMLRATPRRAVVRQMRKVLTFPGQDLDHAARRLGTDDR
jgi:2-polyprenyl-6-methoxyphenol hydroxylase-like FAD-dependent oxidoreductase